jgi:hypothetical protein
VKDDADENLKALTVRAFSVFLGLGSFLGEIHNCGGLEIGAKMQGWAILESAHQY